MNQLQVFKNGKFEVAATLGGGEILFDAEQVAKSLGFVSRTNKNGSAYENVRWSRVNEFLPQAAEVKRGDLIPEPMVYKLAFKAQNEVAEEFQDWLAVEVIPSIRKTGSYQLEQPSNTKLLLQAALEQEEKIEAHDKRINYLEENMRIDGAQEQRIRESANRKVVKCLGGKDSAAYKSISRKVFPQFWREFKNHFEIPRYGELPKVRFDEAIDFIQEWTPSTSLRFDIRALNNQQHLKLAE